MINEIKSIRASFTQAFAKAGTPDDIERIRVQYLGRKGALATIFNTLRSLPDEERKHVGEEANRLRATIERSLAEKQIKLEGTTRESVLKKEWLDVTRPGAKPRRGHVHPLTKIIREINAIFSGMGFETVEGPEVETEYYNFDALNIPANHPARDMWDTFWLKSDHLLLRTHTSPVQVRYMETHNPPFQIIVPGRVYRYEATDASHDIQFYQLEGLVVGKNISIANFKAVIQEFFSRLFKTDIEIRLRPSYFPFTEPSFEVDISCVFCKSKGCGVCKQTGWLEMGGAGMVHPYVFKAARYNPKDITGFAFGMGIDRLAMMKYKIPDIRLFRSGDLRFLRQF